MNLENIDGHLVLEEKNGKTSSDGLFSGCFKTEGNHYFYCVCEFIKKKLVFRTKIEVTESTYENFYWKNPKIEPKNSTLGVAIRDTFQNKPISSQRSFQNFFEDENFFGSGKLHKVFKHDFIELALSISEWDIKTSVPDNAIIKTYSYMSERFSNILSTEEIQDFTIELLGIRKERFSKIIFNSHE